MHAIRHYEFGPAEVMRYEEVDDPVPGPGQVVIAVEAAGVHLLDTVIRAGKAFGAAPPPALPMIPGREVAGRVSALGEGVDGSLLGKRVVVHLGPNGSGGYAERVVANVASLHELPPQVDAATAVAMIGTGRTAFGVLGLAELHRDDVVLITAAAGGLGSIFVQHARNLGATSIGLAGGAEKCRLVSGLGASLAVDYTNDGWQEEVRSYVGERAVTVVLDSVGGSAGRACLELLGAGGRHVMFGWSAGEPTRIETTDIIEKGLTVVCPLGPQLLKRGGGLRALESKALAEAASGLIKPLVTRFELKDAAAAHAALETRGTTGKVVLTP